MTLKKLILAIELLQTYTKLRKLPLIVMTLLCKLEVSTRLVKQLIELFMGLNARKYYQMPVTAQTTVVLACMSKDHQIDWMWKWRAPLTLKLPLLFLTLCLSAK